MLWEYGYATLVLCSTTYYSYLVLRIVLQVPQLGTLGITAPHNRTYPEYSWVVLCVVLCYAVGVLCYATLYCMLCYVLHTLTSPSHVAYIHRGVEDTTHWTMAKEM